MIYIDAGEPYNPHEARTVGAEALTNAQRQSRYRKARGKERLEDIAVLDFETDPFDAQKKKEILPFTACLYAPTALSAPLIIWEKDFDIFVMRVLEAIKRLPRRFTIYAHNGGKFDFMFLIHKIRGAVTFKGRGIMCAKVGEHELRDSFNLVNEKLAAYHKDEFDYQKLLRNRRDKHRDEIIKYMTSDCVYLFDIVRRFVDDYGLKLSAGQAAMHELKKHYGVPRFSENWDAYIREWFFGGRVECLQGRGLFVGPYKLYDVNSMYPKVMADYMHPVGSFSDYVLRMGKPGPDTVFLDITCKNNNALIARGENGETTSRITEGSFKTTIWEYRVAKKYGLIKDVQFNLIVDCLKRTTFADFIVPLYSKRLIVKEKLGVLKKAGREHSAEYLDLKKQDIMLKLILNNAYGKFAQNPRNYKEHYLTDADECPPVEWFKTLETLTASEQTEYMLPHYESDKYWIWHKPNPDIRFNNVGVAASITGAARSILLDAIQNATDPIYCDTDSLICRALDNVEIDKVKLGAWDLEDEFTRVIINGKKLYSCWYEKPRMDSDGKMQNYKIRTKGTAGVTWEQMLDMLKGKSVEVSNRAPTLTKYGTQSYLTRNIKATATETGKLL